MSIALTSALRSGYTVAVSPSKVPAVIVVATRSMLALTEAEIAVVSASKPPVIDGGAEAGLLISLFGTLPLLMYVSRYVAN